MSGNEEGAPLSPSDRLSLPFRLIELPELRDRVRVFHSRTDAGATLAKMMHALRAHRDPAERDRGGQGGEAIVLAVPAGGVPVAAPIARELALELDVAPVSKITPPWNSEVGYGAVAFDGTVRLNEALVQHFGLPAEEVERGIARTRAKVERRARTLRGERPWPVLAGRTVVLVDDGLASGFTMSAAVEAMRKAGAGRVIVSVPTAHRDALQRLPAQVEAVYCANVRSGWQFAVADAYQHWRDVDEEEARRILARFHP